MTSGYHATKIRDHPLNRHWPKSASIPTHRIIMYDAIGEGPHPCHWCGEMLNWGRGTGKGVLNVDHLDGDKKNNVLSNLVVSCHRCNCSRDNPLTLPAGTPYIQRGKVRSRASEKICENCGETFLYAASRKGVRFCSLSCTGKYYQGRKRGPRTTS